MVVSRFSRVYVSFYLTGGPGVPPPPPGIGRRTIGEQLTFPSLSSFSLSHISLSLLSFSSVLTRPLSFFLFPISCFSLYSLVLLCSHSLAFLSSFSQSLCFSLPSPSSSITNHTDSPFQTNPLSTPSPSSSAVSPMKRKIETKYRLPLLNWSSLPATQISGTVFTQLDDEAILRSFDFSQFEEVFKLAKQGTPSGNDKVETNSYHYSKLEGEKV